MQPSTTSGTEGTSSDTTPTMSTRGSTEMTTQETKSGARADSINIAIAGDDDGRLSAHDSATEHIGVDKFIWDYGMCYSPPHVACSLGKGRCP